MNGKHISATAVPAVNATIHYSSTSHIKDLIFKEVIKSLSDLNYWKGYYLEFKLITQEWEKEMEIEKDYNILFSLIEKLVAIERKKEPTTPEAHQENKELIKRLRRLKRKLKKEMKKWLVEQNKLETNFKPQAELGELLEEWITDMKKLFTNNEAFEKVISKNLITEQLKEARRLAYEISIGKDLIENKRRICRYYKYELLVQFIKTYMAIYIYYTRNALPDDRKKYKIRFTLDQEMSKKTEDAIKHKVEAQLKDEKELMKKRKDESNPFSSTGKRRNQNKDQQEDDTAEAKAGKEKLLKQQSASPAPSILKK